ncbi:hypothetical protein NY78_0989 [Desulfovibrio sp. TomC]|nr:hypothetical protein NY78_0989 [Desulfovibrio sp. TomC]
MAQLPELTPVARRRFSRENNCPPSATPAHSAGIIDPGKREKGGAA